MGIEIERDFYKKDYLYIPVCPNSKIKEEKVFCKKINEPCEEIKYKDCILYRYLEKKISKNL